MGQYELPIPRPVSSEIMVVPSTIDRFAADWSVPVDDARLWVCLHEVAHHAVLSRAHVQERLDQLILAYVGAFNPDPHFLEDRLGGLDPSDMAALQETFSKPEVLFGELQTDAQRELMVPLRSLLSVVVGYVDHVMDLTGRRLIGSYGLLTEALRRRRSEEGPGREFVARMFGIELDAASYERGSKFISGVVERSGDEGLVRLWTSARELPTPAEVNAPGLWLARIDLPDN
jgi:putative hydrolase